MYVVLYFRSTGVERYNYQIKIYFIVLLFVDCFVCF